MSMTTSLTTRVTSLILLLWGTACYCNFNFKKIINNDDSNKNNNYNNYNNNNDNYHDNGVKVNDNNNSKMMKINKLLIVLLITIKLLISQWLWRHI